MGSVAESEGTWSAALLLSSSSPLSEQYVLVYIHTCSLHVAPPRLKTSFEVSESVERSPLGEWSVYSSLEFEPTLPVQTGAEIHICSVCNTGVGKLFIATGRFGYSYLYRGTQKEISIVDRKRNCISLTWRGKADIDLKPDNTIFLQTTEFILKSFVSFQTVLISSHC
jgi:hypothetical protein